MFPDTITNQHADTSPALTVSELSSLLKRSVEEQFSQVRVRGEISGNKLAASGHLYLKLKDHDAVLDAVCWRPVVSSLPIKPEDGLEVICTGRLTTYPARSNYQLVIESMEATGLGALMALLEKRKAQLLAEGLFDPARKKLIPAFPRVIGMITSPTGAVIRDILHRLEERFPCHVLLWPVLVQGDQAAMQITAAINGFNALVDHPHPTIPTPDVLIVARGGGSIEDLWPFNEEMVVRAAAASHIPLISAVGHETDTTLIDFAADKRAPTPTAAAEMATPVRAELLDYLSSMRHRQQHAIHGLLRHAAHYVESLARGIPKAERLLELPMQQLDRAWERLLYTSKYFLTPKQNALQLAARLLESLQYKNVLKRGFAIVRHGKETIISHKEKALAHPAVTIEFQDGVVDAQITTTRPTPRRKTTPTGLQDDLFG